MAIANRQRYGYSIGHFLNDCCASMWFTYLLIYLKKVVRLSAAEASALLLIGQLVDGAVTPVVGILSDKHNLFGRYYSRRKSWHALGTLLVCLSFTFIFNEPMVALESDIEIESETISKNSSSGFSDLELGLGFQEPSPSEAGPHAAFFYYIPFIVIFQIGWAIVQISHLSLIPALTCSDGERSDLNSKRYSMLIVANVYIYVMAIWLFNSSECKFTLTRDNSVQFRNLSFAAVGSGLVLTIIFHILVTEGQCEEENPRELSELKSGAPLQRKTRLRSVSQPELGGNAKTRRGSLDCGSDDNDDNDAHSLCSERQIYLSPPENITRISSAEHLSFLVDHNEKKRLQAKLKSGMDDASDKVKNRPGPRLETPMDWLRHLPMYTNGIIYMSARLAQNCLQIYLTLYISDTIRLPTQYLGILPFVQYLFGFLASIATKHIQKAKSTSLAYLVGCLLVFFACVSVHVLSKLVTDELDMIDVISVMFIFALFGGGGNMVVCSALGLTAELIGDNTKSSAFVYGTMSLGDKVFNGVAVIILENINSCEQKRKTTECEKSECQFYGVLISFGIAAILAVGVLFTFIQRRMKIGPYASNK